MLAEIAGVFVGCGVLYWVVGVGLGGRLIGRWAIERAESRLRIGVVVVGIGVLNEEEDLLLCLWAIT